MNDRVNDAYRINRMSEEQKTLPKYYAILAEPIKVKKRESHK